MQSRYNTPIVATSSEEPIWTPRQPQNPHQNGGVPIQQHRRPMGYQSNPAAGEYYQGPNVPDFIREQSIPPSALDAAQTTEVHTTSRPEGIGAMKIEHDTIRIMGRTEFENPVQFSQISSKGDEVLRISISGHSSASLNLKPDGKATFVCERFEILDQDKKLLFFADSNEIGHKLENVRILNEGGTTFESAIQTSKIRPEFDQPLSIESPTRSLKIEAGQDIEILSGAGEVTINSLLDVRINAKEGDVHIDAGDIYMSGLELSTGYGQGTKSAYQLCICKNGRLFLAAENADCRADRHICGG